MSSKGFTQFTLVLVIIVLIAGLSASTTIRDALANIIDFDAIFGKFSFDTVGDALRQLC